METSDESQVTFCSLSRIVEQSVVEMKGINNKKQVR